MYMPTQYTIFCYLFIQTPTITYTCLANVMLNACFVLKHAFRLQVLRHWTSLCQVQLTDQVVLSSYTVEIKLHSHFCVF